MSVISLPSSLSSFVRAESFYLRNSDSAIDTIAGVTQITSYSDRRWTLRFDIIPVRTTNLRVWNSFAMQVSQLQNVFAYGPPHYSGPSTGYAGASPVVAGADQLGLSLDVDGLSISSSILSAGDFFSFDVTTGAGNTNRQLNMVTADVSSNGSGEATFSLLVPIRQAPADNAAVNISTPTAFFRLVNPEAGLNLDVDQFSTFSFDAIERVFT